MHGATAKYIVDYGQFSSYSGYFGYPGAFLLSALLSKTMGLPVLETNILLASFLNLLISFLLFAIGKVYIGEEEGWLVPTIYFAFSGFFKYYYYSPQLLGLCLHIVFVFIVLRRIFKRAPTESILLLILLSALTMVHVFSAVVTVTTLFCVYICGEKIRVLKLKNKHFITLPVFLFGALLFIAWHILIANETFEVSIDFLSSIIKGYRTPSGFTEAILHKPSRSVFTLWLQSYRYGTYTLLAFASICGLVLFWHRKEVKLIFLSALGVIIGAMLIYLTPAIWGLGRVLSFFGGIIISLLASYAMVEQNVKISKVHQALRILKKIVPFMVIGTFLVANLDVSVYTLFVHPDEIRAIEFAARNVNRPISVIVHEAFIIRYIAGDSLSVRVVDDGLPSDIAKSKFEKGDVSLQYLPRQQYYYNLTFAEGNNNLVYSNGLCRIYSKTSH
ncbi:MAG: hypothetical protein QXF61_03355 [Nitrososphaeria archaeon]